MKTKTLLISFLLLLGISLNAQTFGDGDAPPFVLRGYVKEIPALQLDRNFSDPNFINFVHNRLNFRWNIAKDFHFVAEGHNSLFYNDMFKDYPFFKDILE